MEFHFSGGPTGVESPHEPLPLMECKLGRRRVDLLLAQYDHPSQLEASSFQGIVRGTVELRDVERINQVTTLVGLAGEVGPVSNRCSSGCPGILEATLVDRGCLDTNC